MMVHLITQKLMMIINIIIIVTTIKRKEASSSSSAVAGKDFDLLLEVTNLHHVILRVIQLNPMLALERDKTETSYHIIIAATIHIVIGPDIIV